MFDDVPKFTKPHKTHYAVIRPKRYNHQMMTGKCIYCGQDRLGACSCVPAQRYSYTKMRDDYKQQCAEDTVGRAFQRAGDVMIVFGDALKNFPIAVREWMPENYFAMVNQRTRNR